jgi:hypothetical protein
MGVIVMAIERDDLDTSGCNCIAKRHSTRFEVTFFHLAPHDVAPERCQRAINYLTCGRSENAPPIKVRIIKRDNKKGQEKTKKKMNANR